jgi:hypothetical protein
MSDLRRFFLQQAALIALSVITLGCATDLQPPTPDVEVIGELASHCTPATTSQPPPDMRPPSVPDHNGMTGPDNESLGAIGLSPRAAQMASIVGINPLLRRLPTLKEQAAAEVEGTALRLLTLRRQLSDRLLLVLIETGSIAAELDCERARAEEFAVRLEEIQNDIQHGRTIRAIVGEAGLQMAAGGLLVLGLSTAAGVSQITGNLNALVHGLAALGGDQETNMIQDRNLLGEVWDAPDTPVLFPPPVWRFLNQPADDGDGETRRETILSVWRGRLGPPGTEIETQRRELFFGKGGIYDVEELRHRADMLALLKAFVNLMHQDLNLLFRETLVLVNQAGTGES